MKYHLADPSYRVTTDLHYHNDAIIEAVQSLLPHATTHIHRFYFEVCTPHLDEIDLEQLNEEIAKRDNYLTTLYVQYPIHKQNDNIIVKPLLFVLRLH